MNISEASIDAYPPPPFIAFELYELMHFRDMRLTTEGYYRL